MLNPYLKPIDSTRLPALRSLRIKKAQSHWLSCETNRLDLFSALRAQAINPFELRGRAMGSGDATQGGGNPIGTCTGLGLVHRKNGRMGGGPIEAYRSWLPARPAPPAPAFTQNPPDAARVPVGSVLFQWRGPRTRETAYRVESFRPTQHSPLAMVRPPTSLASG